MPTPTESYIQQLDLPSVVELFDIFYNNTHYYLTNSLGGGTIFWNGQEYGAFPIAISDITYNETNTDEVPKLSVSNVGQHFSQVVIQVPNMKGAKVTYVKTFETYCGNTSSESASLFLHKRQLTVDKLLSKNATQVVYELGTYTNFKQKIFPPRQMLRDGRPRMRFEGLGINKTP